MKLRKSLINHFASFLFAPTNQVFFIGEKLFSPNAFNQFLLVCFIKFSAASTHHIVENEILSFPRKVAPKTFAIYEREKNNIISFIRNEFRTKNEFFCTEFDLMIKNFCKLNPKELLTVMLWDNESEYILTIFWFVIGSAGSRIRFKRTNTLYSLKLPLQFKNRDTVGRIFKNFRHFIFQASINNCPQKESDGKELLSISQMFWHQKLVPLGIKVMDEDELELEHKLIEKQFRFLDRFFNNDPQVQIIWEYKSLQRAIQNDLKSAFANKSFSFLTQHLNYRLRTLPYSEFLDDLGWLASQSQLFLTYFFYVLGWQFQFGEIPPRLFLNHKAILDWVRCDFIYLFIILTGNDFLIFSKRTYDSKMEQAEAVRLARVILDKLNKKI